MTEPAVPSALQPAPKPAARTRPWVLWLGVWLALTFASVALHWAFWMEGPRMSGGMSQTAWRALANLYFTPSTPLGIALGFGMDIWEGGIPKAILMHGVSWAMWLTLLGIILRDRRKTIARAKDATEGRPVDFSRRRLLMNAATGAGAVGIAAPLAVGTLVRPWNLKTPSYTVKIKGLPEPLRGLKLAQISDTHLGPRIPAEFVSRAIGLALDMKPDVFVLTGDYIHNGPKYIPLAARLFKPIMETGRPVVGTLGNHDWYADGQAMSLALTKIGVRMIDNSRVYLDAATRLLADVPPESGLCLAGFGDYTEASIDPESALAGVPPDMPRVVLSHNPDSVEDTLVTKGPRVDLMLSGHLHGGQIRLPLVGYPVTHSQYGRKYLGGLVQAPTCQIVISRGVGMSVVPVRLGVDPEVVEIILQPA